MFGYDVVVISGVIPQILSQFSLSPGQLGFFVSSVLWGCAIGSVIGGLALDLSGRKRVLVSAALIMLISAVWSSAAESPATLISARLLGGIGCGAVTTACPLYISELSPERDRGRMVTLYHFAVCLGIVVCVFVNWALYLFAASGGSQGTTVPALTWFFIDQSWRAMLGSEALPGLLFFLLAFAMPESPRWLVKKGNLENASSILARINGREKAILICQEIKNTLLMEKTMTLFSLFTTQLRQPLVLGVLICIFSEASGISAVLYYGPQLFEQAGLSLGSSLGGFSVIAIVNMAFNLVAMRYIDELGRRRVLFIGSSGALFSLVVIGCLYLWGHAGWPIVVMFILFIAFFAASIGPVKFVVLSEIFPNQIRGKAVAAGTVCIWITSAAVAQLFSMMRELMHTGFLFFFFAVDVAALLLVVIFLLPETRGRTIEEIERSWLGQTMKDSDGRV